MSHDEQAIATGSQGGSGGEPPTPDVGPFRPGQVVADAYEITSVLGSGGMGVVYAAHDRWLNRRVALKVAHATENASALRNEARALAAVRHPNLVAVYALARHEGVEVMVMERIGGRTLDDHLQTRIRSGRSLPIEEVIDILVAVTDALTAVHRAGIAHRDVKTANVMMCGTRVVLTDFGLVTPEFDVHEESMVAGSADYMAPELIRGSVRRGAGPLVDLYALGVVAFELLTGSPPFPADDVREVLARHLRDPVPDVRAQRADVPDALAELVRGLLAKSPDERPETAEVVLWRLGAMRTKGPHEGMRVLVVDDDRSVGSVLRRSLQAALPGLSVHVAASGEEALARLELEPHDIVLTDLHMPGMSGVELSMLLMAMPEERRPMIVAMSAAARPDDVDLLHALGVAAFVPKGGDFVARVCSVIGDLRRQRRGIASSRPPTRSS